MLQVRISQEAYIVNSYTHQQKSTANCYRFGYLLLFLTDGTANNVLMPETKCKL